MANKQCVIRFIDYNNSNQIKSVIVESSTIGEAVKTGLPRVLRNEGYSPQEIKYILDNKKYYPIRYDKLESGIEEEL